MITLPDNQSARLANYFGAKLRELHFHLETIVNDAEESLSRFQQEAQQDETGHRRLTYAFSSFTNVIQSLKDSGANFCKFEWRELHNVPHGHFMKEVRNAITHDGNPVITCWSDGRFFVPSKIVRWDSMKKEVVAITPPAVDVRTFCLEFSAGFGRFINEKLTPHQGNAEFSNSALSFAEVEEAFNGEHMSAFAKEQFEKDRDMIRAALAEQKIDHIGNAIKAAIDLTTYSEARLQPVFQHAVAESR